MNPSEQKPGRRPWWPELCGGGVLAALVVYFLRVSWRKWPDPIVDSGQQWYAAWRISQGGNLFREEAWNYGPLSAYFNGLLFKIFGANLTVLFTANLLIYGLILVLAWAAFRRAWGPMGAFAACAVFISVFSFSHLTSVGNYTYAAPYAHECTHGMLIMVLTLFAAARWSRRPSAAMAFALGSCGGLAAMLKPEFMLAGGALGMAALGLRWMQRQEVTLVEWTLLAAGVAWPTLAFALGFAATEPLGTACAHAANAWWVIMYNFFGVPGFAEGQRAYAGLDDPLRSAWLELQAGLRAGVVIAAIWAGGWFLNRPRSAVRIAVVLILGAAALNVRLDGGWFHVGGCLPLLMAAGLIWACVRLWRQKRAEGKLEDAAVMRFLLVLLAAAMLARMVLFARVYHFGFFQAALAGMVAAAMMAAEMPRWTGASRAGVAVAAAGSLLVLTLGCVSIARKSNAIRAEQTQPVASGADRFYAFNREVDPTATLVDWVVKRLASTPPSATVLVLPEGVSIDFLARRVTPLPELEGNWAEELLVQKLWWAPPDYVVLISVNLADHDLSNYGAPGRPGYLMLQWVKHNYVAEASWGEPFSGGRLKGARILRRKPASP